MISSNTQIFTFPSNSHARSNSSRSAHRVRMMIAAVNILSHLRNDIPLVYLSHMTLCILGRQPALGIAELESLYGARVIQPIGKTAALVDADITFERLGGTKKAAEIIA